MPQHQRTVPPAALPVRKVFDPWNSSGTGHQRAENRLGGSPAWRESRTMKLASQYGAGPGGGKRIADTVGPGSMDGGTDGRRKHGHRDVGAPGSRESGGHGVRALLRGPERQPPGPEEHRREGLDGAHENSTRPELDAADETTPARSKIFHNLRIYVNGSTAPMVSDHRLKQLLVEHGGHISLALGRRSVTHVILGTPNGARGGVLGAGGGLAASKIQKEIRRVGGCGVKYVGVDWVLESIKAGKRLPEARFANLSLAAKGQKSVSGWFPPAAHDPEAGAGTTGSNGLGAETSGSNGGPA
ncbi:hypothetical protein MMC07_009957 [Pseudocyphellaria aurata]|nr:hypothetical protein [Pseudocyphellaria aurata]